MIKTVTRIVVPFIFAFGMYVVMNGHLSPGGAFAGGSIIGAGYVLLSLIGITPVRGLLNEDTAGVVESLGVGMYALIGFVGIVLGRAFLTNRAAGFPMGRPGDLLSSGMIFLVTIGLGAKVASTIVSLFRGVAHDHEEGER